MSKEQFLSRLNKLRIKMVDYFHLIFKSTHFNYYRIESCKKDETGKIHCDITFDSYSALRQFQNKLRKISFGVGSLVTTTVIVSLIINLSTGPVINSWAATYSFTQTNWSGGVSDSIAIHDTSNGQAQQEWLQFASSSMNLEIANYGADLQLGAATSSISHTDADTFGSPNSTLDSTVISGLGANASVQLSSTVVPLNKWDSQLPPLPETLKNYSTLTAFGDDVYVLAGSNSTGFYKYSISANAWTTLSSIPGTPGQGASLVRNGSDDGIYVLRGNNTNNLYRYSISADTWTTLAAAPGTISGGAQMARNGSDDEVYVLRGNNTNNLYRYSISADTWTTLAAAPGTISVWTQMARNGSDNEVYVINASYLYRYSISANTWTTLASAPNYISGGILRNGSDDFIYALRAGNSRDFYRYSISANTWTTLANAVGAAIESGAKIIRNGNDDAIYVTRNDNTSAFSKYSISTNTWTGLASAPGTYGPLLIFRNGASNDIYGLSKVNSTSFFRYSISTNTWTGNHVSTLEPILGTVGSGMQIARNGSDDEVYVLRGNNTNNLYRYSISANTWMTLANAPGTISTGAQVVRNGSDDEVYVLRGNSTNNLYRYSISANTWTTLANAPGTISLRSQMVRNGSDDEIYVLRVDTVWDSGCDCLITLEGVYKYSISANTWTTLASIPGTIGDGVSLIRNGSEDFAYALKGNGTKDFYRYSISTDTWTPLASTTIGIGDGSRMIRNGSDDAIYLQTNSKTFHRYSITANTWTTLAPTPVYAIDRSTLLLRKGSDDNIYTLFGSSHGSPNFAKYSISANTWSTPPDTTLPQNTYLGASGFMGAFDDDIYAIGGDSTNLYHYVIQQKTYAFVGTYTSAAIDAGFPVSEWGSISWVHSLGQTLSIKVRTDADGDFSNATPWGSCLSITSGGVASDGGCATGGHRYIQYLATLSTTDSRRTPSLDSINFAYTTFANSEYLISSQYNTGIDENVMGFVSWTEDDALPSGTGVTLSLRTATSSAALDVAAWYDLTSSSTSCYKASAIVTCPSAALASASATLTDGVDDQWYQYKISLSSDGSNTPTVSDVNVAYVVNAPPTVSDVIASQINSSQFITTPQGNILAATGSVIVSANVLDFDTDSGSYNDGSMRNKLEISMKYFKTDSETWEDVSTSSIQGMPTDFIIDQVSSSTLRNFTLIWNPNNEYDNQENDSNFKVQINANDKEGANNITASSSPEFIIDTKAPIVDIGTAIKVDARQTNEMAIANEIAIIFQATDISGVYYRYSVSSSTDGNGFLLPAAGVTDANSGQWILKNTEGIATTTVKVASETDKIYIQYRDGLDNFNPTIYNVTIPTSVNSIMVQDVTNTYIDPSDVQLYLAWRESSLPLGGSNVGEFKAYYIERAVYTSDPGLNFVPGNTDFVQVSSSTDRQVNYYTDNNVVEDYHYYYRVYIEDGVGNFSYYTGESDTNIVMHGVPNGIQDFGEGGGGTSVGIPPVISSVEVAETLTTQAKIIWNTDILANSSVEYITAVGTTTPTVEDFANAPFKGVATMLNNAEGLGKHNVVIDGLDSNTQYYFRVKSTGIDGTEGTSFNETYQFTTLDGPRIASSTIIVTGKTNDSLTIEWNTDIAANSFVGYSTDSNMTNPAPVEVGQDDSVTNHSVTINSLAPGTRYFFYVKSGTGKDNNLGNYYNDMTTTDATAPSFIGTATSTPKRTSVLITWQTDEVSDSTITIGTSTGAYSQTITDEVLTMYHVIAINSLSASSTYYYKVISSDANGNVATSTEYMFTTEGVALTNVIAVTTGETSVDITWNTDENTTSQVLYSTSSAGLIGGTYKPVLPDDSTQNHSVTIDNLINSTKYYYRVISTVDGFTVESPIYYFTSGDISAPTISNVQAINISTNGATINWTTDETADTLVEWGTESGIYTASTSNSALTRTHSIAISGLDTFNRYYYRVISQDVNSNATTSQEYDFTTANFTISDVFADAATSSVVVTWTTDELTSSQVEYTTDANFVSGLTSYPTSPNDATTTHSITITGLSDGLYYYRVHSAKDNQDNASIIYTFSISDDQGAPVISGLQTSTITDTSAVIYWTTDESSDSVIYYGTTADGQYASSTENPIPTTLHFITLNNLSASTTYYFYVESSDGSSNMATSTESSFTTLSLRYSGDDLAEELQSMEDEIAALTAELATKASLLYSQADLQTRLDQISTLEDQLEEANNKSSGGMLVIDKTDKTAPKISNVKMAEVGDTYAKITWDTDEDASSMIGYGFTDAYDSAESDYQSYIKRSKGHTVYLRKLLPSSSYHFAVVSADASGNMSSSPDFTLTTLAAGEEAKKDMEAEAKQDAENTLTKIQEMINELLASGKVNPEDIRSAIQKTGEPPMISGAGPEISDLTAKSVTISWKTNRKSNSIISYYIESMGRDSAEQIGNYSALVTDHTVKISNLAPGRKYVFTAQSVDALGNVGASDQKSFETVGIPFISEVSMSNITNTSIDISWLSNTETNSELDYGSSVVYGKTAKSNSLDYILNHSIRLNDLKPGQTYHFKAKGLTRKGDIISSDDYTFTTLTSFDVLTYSINKITDKSANINWKTTNDSTSEIEYTNTATKVTDLVKSGEFTKDHNIKLVNLIPGTRYTFKIKGKDKFEQATESEGFEFSTLIDTQAPIIEYVQTDMALISKGDQNSVQAVVTWKTNEPSTSEIIYTEGGAKNLPTLDSSKTATSTDKKVSTEEVSIGNDKFTIAKDGGGMTQKHVLVITDFKPSTVYTFKARSIDEAGNVSYSKDYTVLAPSKEESVLQIIIKTFEDTFGWLKMK